MTDKLHRHRLEGLEADNLLAFLALLGLLRALETSRPQWRPRAAWDLDHPPLHPELRLAEPASIDSICEAAEEGLSVFWKALLPFSRQKNKQGRANKILISRTPEKYRRSAEHSISAYHAAIAKGDRRRALVWRIRLDLLTSGVGEVWNKNKYQIEASPLKLPSGQMSFVGAMFEAVKACHKSDIERSLLRPWEFQSKGDSLRLAYQEARRYAYRATDPSPEGARSERGATALGAFGMLAYRLVPRSQHLGMLAYTGERKDGWVLWPIWRFRSGSGASYSSVITLLAALHDSVSDRGFNLPDEVIGYVRAKRFVLDPKQGDYGNIAPGEFIWRADRRWKDA